MLVCVYAYKYTVYSTYVYIIYIHILYIYCIDIERMIMYIVCVIYICRISIVYKCNIYIYMYPISSVSSSGTTSMLSLGRICQLLPALKSLEPTPSKRPRKPSIWVRGVALGGQITSMAKNMFIQIPVAIQHLCIAMVRVSILYFRFFLFFLNLYTQQQNHTPTSKPSSLNSVYQSICVYVCNI